MTDDKKWALGWAKFDALYKNLPKHPTEDVVRDFHQILDLIQEASGEDLSPFRIPEPRIQPHVVSFNVVSGKQQLSSTRYCDRDYFLAQMDGVRGYFENLRPRPERPHVGF